MRIQLYVILKAYQYIFSFCLYYIREESSQINSTRGEESVGQFGKLRPTNESPGAPVSSLVKGDVNNIHSLVLGGLL